MNHNWHLSFKTLGKDIAEGSKDVHDAVNKFVADLKGKGHNVVATAVTCDGTTAAPPKPAEEKTP